MKAKHLFIASTLLVAACGESPQKQQNQADPSVDKHMLRPGVYEIKFHRELMLPGQPPEPSDEVDSQCFSATDLAEPQKVLVPNSGNCTMQEAKAEGGYVSASMTCHVPEISESELIFGVHGNYNPEGAELTGESNVDGATLHETRTFRRTGDC